MAPLVAMTSSRLRPQSVQNLALGALTVLQSGQAFMPRWVTWDESVRASNSPHRSHDSSSSPLLVPQWAQYTLKATCLLIIYAQ